MGILLVLIVITVISSVVFYINFLKITVDDPISKEVPVLPEKPIIRIKNIDDEISLKIGENFQIDYDFIDENTGNVLGSNPLHGWRVVRDPRVGNEGAPDVLTFFITQTGYITPMDRGNRVIFAYLNSDPDTHLVEIKVNIT